MEPEGSSPRSQDPFTCPHPEPDQSSPRALTDFYLSPILTYMPYTNTYSKYHLNSASCWRFLSETFVISFQNINYKRYNSGSVTNCAWDGRKIIAGFMTQ